MPPFPTILFATDYSNRSRAAYEVARALAREGSRLVVLHVVESVPVASEGYEQAHLERLREYEPAEPGVVMDYRLEEGDPAETILLLAKDTDCSLIVISSHGRTGLDRVVMGSVAERIAQAAHCPVLIYRPGRAASLHHK